MNLIFGKRKRENIEEDNQIMKHFYKKRGYKDFFLILPWFLNFYDTKNVSIIKSARCFLKNKRSK